MTHQMFLSHDSRDRVKANILATAITRMTLAQIAVWNSSDGSGNGGLQPGHVWLDEIRTRLAASRAVVALLTPTSIARPWLLFESGFGAANPDCDVIPVCIGVDNTTDVPFPLAMYQTYLLSDYESLKRFAEKLLGRYEIHFDEEMVRPVLTEAVKQLSQAEEAQTPKQLARKELTLFNVVEDLKEHIDKRLVALMSSDSPSQAGVSGSQHYTVAIEISLRTKTNSTQFIEIDSSTTVENVLDNIYFMLNGEVEAYQYLEQWVLRDPTTGKYLVIREIQDRIPATTIFTPGSRWEVVRLAKPYTASERH
jgi:TIR domain